jgi:replicative DNA helicase
MTDNLLDKLPPQDRACEIGTLSSMLKHPACIPAVMNEVSSGDFYHTEYRHVFTALVDLWKTVQTADACLLPSQLDKMGKLEEVGGHDFVFDLLDAAPPSGAMAVFYARVVREKSLLRQGIQICGRAMGNLYGPSADPAPDRLLEIMGALRTVAEKDCRSEVVSLADATAGVHAAIKTPAESGRPVPTGYQVLDNTLYGGFSGGNVYLIAGRTGSGKTTLALNFARNMVVSLENPLYVSLEMSTDELTRCFMAGHVQTNYYNLMNWKGKIDLVGAALADWQIGRIEEMKSGICKMDITNKTWRVSQIEAILSRARDIGKPYTVLFVDHIHLMKPEADLRSDNEAIRFGSIGNGLKRLASDFGIPAVVLAQVNRGDNTSRPRLHDLKYSGDLENIGTVVMFTWLSEEEKALKETNQQEIYIEKGRFQGLGDMLGTWNKPMWWVKNIRGEMK